MKEVRDAYTAGATAWADGPSRVYGRLADALVAFSPRPLTGTSVLDLGSGTGVGSRAAQHAGARVVATDLSTGMLRVDRARRPPAAAGDALALPFRDRAFDVVLAPFSLNHLPDPAAGVREAARVGTRLLASTYADDDDHPVKQAVEVALGELGWERPEWYVQLKTAMQASGTVASVTASISRGGLVPERVEKLEIAFPELAPQDLVEWRLGMATSAPFVAALSPDERARLVERALDLAGGPSVEPLVRRVIFLAAVNDRAR